MEHDFWHERWRTGQIGFHEEQANHFLSAHFKNTFPDTDSRVFLPLCGKTRDIAWLLAQGYRVAGAELSEQAVTELFAELAIEPRTTNLGKLQHHHAPDLDIFTGDIFDLTREQLGPIDIVYDRAALVALPPQTRPGYASHLIRITNQAPQFLISFDYDQSRLDGPPFAVPKAELQRLYGTHYDLTPLASIEVEGGLKGKCPATETLWLLKAKDK